MSTMTIHCPWCGSTHKEYTPTCSRCGGWMPAPQEAPEADAGHREKTPPLAPPPAPRQFAPDYFRRFLLTDQWVLVSGLFLFFAVVFTPLGLLMSLSKLIRSTGLIFLLIGGSGLVLGALLAAYRYNEDKIYLRLLTSGDAVVGKVTEISENFLVSKGTRSHSVHPFNIRYTFQVNGQEYRGRVEAFRPFRKALREGSATYVLYLPNSPWRNTLYPIP
jgi:hypothetical protein